VGHDVAFDNVNLSSSLSDVDKAFKGISSNFESREEQNSFKYSSLNEIPAKNNTVPDKDFSPTQSMMTRKARQQVDFQDLGLGMLKVR